jgi:hypothetical protein
MENLDHLGDETLTLLYYGELTGADEVAARTHLGVCPACRRQHDELLRLFALVDNDLVPEPPPGFEAAVWRRLEPSLAAASGSSGETSGLSWRLRRWLAWPRPMRWSLAGAMAMVVVLAFVAGRMWERSPGEGTQASQDGDAVDVAGLRERVLLSALGDHLDRSEGVIVDLATAAPAAGLDISADQRRAVDLLASTRIYRRAALEAGDRNVAAVLEALERVLVEATMSPATPSAYELAALQARITKQELLFRLRAASLAVRDREGHSRRAAVPGAGV